MTTRSTKIEMVDALFVSDYVEARPFVSTLFGPDNRATVLGQFANGDRVHVPVADVIARPLSFLAPCGKAYIVKGATLVNPCTDTVDEPEDQPQQPESLGGVVDLQESRRQMSEMFGTDAAYEKLESAGYFTADSVRGLDDETLSGIVGKGALRNYQRYLKQAETAVEVEADVQDAG